MAEATKTKRDWRREPGPSEYEMTQSAYEGEPTIFPAGESYGKDRARMASALDCEFTEVRMETYWMVWDAVTAEAEWRRERCTCEHPAGGDENWCCEPITDCKTTKPAEEVWDFWDESGIHCPWYRCDPKQQPKAVKFRRGWIAGDEAMR
jgi:hypothetical protein